MVLAGEVRVEGKIMTNMYLVMSLRDPYYAPNIVWTTMTRMKPYFFKVYRDTNKVEMDDDLKYALVEMMVGDIVAFIADTQEEIKTRLQMENYRNYFSEQLKFECVEEKSSQRETWGAGEEVWLNLNTGAMWIS